MTRKIIENTEKAIVADAKLNPKGFWRRVSAANPFRHDIPDLMKEEGKKASEAKEKADSIKFIFGTNFSTRPIANPRLTLLEQQTQEPMYMLTKSIEDVRLKDSMQTKLLGQITYNTDY